MPAIESTNRSSLRYRSRAAAFFGSLALVTGLVVGATGCSAPTDDGIEAEQTEDQLRNDTDEIVEKLSWDIPAVNPKQSGVDSWTVFLVKTKEGELYTVARGFRENAASSKADLAVVDIDLMASKPDKVTIQPANPNTYVVDGARIGVLAQELEGIIAVIGTDEKDCKKKRAGRMLGQAVKALLIGSGAAVTCFTALVEIVSIVACVPLTGWTLKTAGTAVSERVQLKCEDFPRE